MPPYVQVVPFNFLWSDWHCPLCDIKGTIKAKVHFYRDPNGLIEIKTWFSCLRVIGRHASHYIPLISCETNGWRRHSPKFKHGWVIFAVVSLIFQSVHTFPPNNLLWMNAVHATRLKSLIPLSISFRQVTNLSSALGKAPWTHQQNGTSRMFRLPEVSSLCRQFPILAVRWVKKNLFDNSGVHFGISN